MSRARNSYAGIIIGVDVGISVGVSVQVPVAVRVPISSRPRWVPVETRGQEEKCPDEGYASLPNHQVGGYHLDTLAEREEAETESVIGDDRPTR